MGPVIGLVMVGMAIYGFLNAERAVDRVRDQWEGKRVPATLRWVFGDPPSATHVRRVNLAAAVVFTLPLVIRLVA